MAELILEEVQALVRHFLAGSGTVAEMALLHQAMAEDSAVALELVAQVQEAFENRPPARLSPVQDAQILLRVDALIAPLIQYTGVKGRLKKILGRTKASQRSSYGEPQALPAAPPEPAQAESAPAQAAEAPAPAARFVPTSEAIAAGLAPSAPSAEPAPTAPAGVQPAAPAPMPEPVAATPTAPEPVAAEAPAPEPVTEATASPAAETFEAAPLEPGAEGPSPQADSDYRPARSLDLDDVLVEKPRSKALIIGAVAVVLLFLAWALTRRPSAPPVRPAVAAPLAMPTLRPTPVPTVGVQRADAALPLTETSLPVEMPPLTPMPAGYHPAPR